MEIAKKSTNDRNDPKSPKTTETTKATKQKILRPDDSENDQFGRKRPKMATLAFRLERALELSSHLRAVGTSKNRRGQVVFNEVDII